jgi:hypothetical protein
MIEPLPNCRSIWASALSSAFCLSTATHEAFRNLADIVVTDPTEMRHMSLEYWWRIMGRRLARRAGSPLKTVAVIRDPVDWLGSWYRYRSRADIPDPVRSTRGLEFDEFVGDYLSDMPSPMTADISDPIRFFCNSAGDIAVDHIFAYENWATFQGFMVKTVGDPGAVSERNVSPARETALSSPLRRRIEARLAPAIRLHRMALEGETTGVVPPELSLQPIWLRTTAERSLSENGLARNTASSNSA